MSINYIYNEEERKKLFDKVSNENDINGEQIRQLLKKHFELEGYMTISERNHRSTNENPFDLVCGKEKNLEMIGIEIKGDTDNFNRLKDQLQAYSFVFEEIYLVLHKKVKPEWLPEYVGVIIISEDGTLYTISHCFKRDLYEIGSDYEWDSLLKCNGLGKISTKCKGTLKILESIRRNVLFNRFFGSLSPKINSFGFEKFYPLTDDQKKVIIGFDVPNQMELINKDVLLIEKRLSLIKQAVKMDNINNVLIEKQNKL